MIVAEAKTSIKTISAKVKAEADTKRSSTSPSEKQERSLDKESATLDKLSTSTDAVPKREQSPVDSRRTSDDHHRMHRSPGNARAQEVSERTASRSSGRREQRTTRDAHYSSARRSSPQSNLSKMHRDSRRRQERSSDDDE